MMKTSQRVSTTANRLREILEIRRMRQIDLARMTDIAKGTINNYLKGKYEPKPPIVAKLAYALNCSDMWLMGFDVPMERNYIDPSDDEFVNSIPRLHSKQELPPELEAVNTLLHSFGRQIFKANGYYYLDECGILTGDEVNELLNTVAIAAKNAADMLTAKKTKDLKNYFTKED